MVGNLGKLPIAGRSRVNYVPRDDAGFCIKNGKRGTIKKVNGRYVCVTRNEESEMTDFSEFTEAKALRFSAPSRTQIGKQFAIFDTHMRAVQGQGNLTVTPIQGAPGNWFFDVKSPSENRFLDTSRLNGKLVQGVNVTATNESQNQVPTAPAKPKSVAERIQEMVNDAKAKITA